VTGSERIRLGPFEEAAVAARYEGWYECEGRRADRLEKRLLGRLLESLGPCRSLLEVGAGTGHFTRWFARQRGIRVTGLDRSMAMLLEARRAGGVAYLRADAAALPFADRAFDVVALITTLEFVADPGAAIAQAWRVARRGLLIGALNRRSLLGRRLQRRGGPIWGGARLWTVRELRQLVSRGSPAASEGAAVRTALWPLWPGTSRWPWGGFIGLAVARPGEGAEREGA